MVQTYSDIPVVSLEKTGGLTSAQQMIDAASNEIFSFGKLQSTSCSWESVLILRPVPIESETEQKMEFYIMDLPTLQMCISKGLLKYIQPLCNMIRDIYRGFIAISMERVDDPEVPGYEKLCFDIHLNSVRQEMLEDKYKFYNAFFDRIPEDKRQHFVFTYMVS